MESVTKEKQDDFRNTLLKQNLLPSTGKEPVAEEKPKEDGYNNQERGEIDALFGGTPTHNE